MAAERAEREREARDRLASSYWGLHSNALERKVARPEPSIDAEVSPQPESYDLVSVPASEAVLLEMSQAPAPQIP